MVNILAAGKWSRSQVFSQWTENRRISNPEVDALIESAWREAMARPGINLFDGPMCRIESWSATPDRIDLQVSQTSYKICFGTNLAHPELIDRFGREMMGNALGLSPALVTADGKLVMGYRNSRVAYYPGRVHPFAGALEPKDAADVFAGVMREMQEELHLTESDIVSIDCIGLAEDARLRQPEIFFAVKTTRTFADLSEMMDATEHRDIWSIEASHNAIEGVLRGTGLLTPIGVGCLLLWGFDQFGQSWLDGAVQVVNR